MENIKNLVVIAGRVQEALTKLRHNRYLESLNQLKALSNHLTEVTGQSRKLAISLSREWLYAAEVCRNSVARSLGEISYHISRFDQLIDKQNGEVPRLFTIVEDLRELQEEFEKVDFNKEDNAITVTTKAITLDDVYLGPFEIRLELNKLPELYRGSPYHCIALDPHPAAASEDVTHPHVSAERLCEGEGATAIRVALEQGRLFDFFSLVNSILNTYSPDSPYVSLDNWNGEPCRECGSVVDGEDRYWCGFCDNGYCDQCCSLCGVCSETVCNNCSQVCASCEEGVCPNCITECEECHCLLCNRCAEENLCPNCIQERKTEDERDESSQATGTCEATTSTQSQQTGTEARLPG